jgi:hypothetical protein
MWAKSEGCILKSMRARGALALFAVLTALVAAPAEAGPPGNGTLSVRDGRGMVQLSSRGTVIGRIERGKITVTDPNPFDARKPRVWGAQTARKSRNQKTTVYSGRNLRLRSTSGYFHVRFQGRGIQLSAVGRGKGLIQGMPQDPSAPQVSDGIWSLNDEEYQSLPEEVTGFDLLAPPPIPE